jgi:hypothetical protein
VLLSDFIGGVGEILIAIPAIKDQVYRFNSDRQKRKKANAPWPGLRDAASRAWEGGRNAFDGRDSLMTMLGALGIALSFVLKLFDA